jgi:D-cysteine desulfhydrase
MPAADLALFRAFPVLRGALPRRPLLAGPTPVGPLALPGFAAGSLYVKHDEHSAPCYGGNKPRKLEFLLAGARARGSRRLVTAGGLGTNHGLATTIHGARAGLATTLVLIDQPLTAEVREKLLLDAAYGAELIYGRNVAGVALAAARVLARAQLRGERPMWIPSGGSSPLGNVGFVSAAFELAEQIRAGALPEPAELYVPVGTAGTQVGLQLGLRLAGLGTRVVGVLVSDILPPTPRRMLRAARATLALLRRGDPSVPDPGLALGDFRLLRGQLGAGYGVPTAEGGAAIEAAAAAGLALDSTYTGKCLAALLERKPGAAGGPLLFWNTYNAVDAAAAAPRPLDPGLLPPDILRRLARKTRE